MREFRNIHIDEPESFHGANFGPSSLEYLLIGIGGCYGATFCFCLQKHQIELEDLEINVDGTLSHNAEERLRLVNVDVDIQYLFKDGYDLNKLKLCLKSFQKHCVVSNSLMEGIKFHVETSELRESK